MSCHLLIIWLPAPAPPAKQPQWPEADSGPALLKVENNTGADCWQTGYSPPALVHGCFSSARKLGKAFNVWDMGWGPKRGREEGHMVSSPFPYT